MIPVDLVGAIRRGLAKDRRPEDGLLHCSSDILGSLRHAQLRIAGAPTIESEIVSDIRLKTGTMWHDLIREFFVNEGLAVMGEVRLKDWLPEGWTGTADWLFWDFNKRCFVLGDLKTTKGEGMYYIEKEGAKVEHVAQLSAYYHALVTAGMPVRKGFFVCYLPMNTDSDKRLEVVEPTIIDCIPLNKEDLWAEMEDRWTKTQTYLGAIEEERSRWARETGEHPLSYPTDDDVLNELLAPPIEREQKLIWDKQRGRYDVKLVPSWRTKFCPYVNELCDCSEQGTTKIGHYDLDDNRVTYTPRVGFENIEPTVHLTAADEMRLTLAG